MPPCYAEETIMAASTPLHLKHEIAGVEDENDNSQSPDDSRLSSRPALHRGVFGHFDERMTRQGEHMRIPKEIASEPRPGARQRFGSAGCLRARLFDGSEEELEALELPPLPTLGLRQRKPKAHETWDDSPTRTQGSDVATVRRQGAAPRSRSRWIIPAEHYLKVLWDIMTVILSLANAHATHVSIGKRNFGDSKFMIFCNLWFLVDVILNFVTERKTADGVVLRDYRSIIARYLTSWFAVDALSLLPWESVYVQPIFDLQKRRGFFQRSFFRSKAVVRVTTHLRGRHFRWFGTAARHAKHQGIGASRLLRVVIKYLPKYLLFFRNMKGVVAVRVLRQVHWCRRFYHNIVQSNEKGDGMTGSLTRDDFEDDLSSNVSFGDPRSVRVVYEGWEQLDDDDDDDGVPL
jgi:hypothetical protein